MFGREVWNCGLWPVGGEGEHVRGLGKVLEGRSCRRLSLMSSVENYLASRCFLCLAGFSGRTRNMTKIRI